MSHTSMKFSLEFYISQAFHNSLSFEKPLFEISFILANFLTDFDWDSSTTSFESTLAMRFIIFDLSSIVFVPMGTFETWYFFFLVIIVDKIWLKVFRGPPLL